ncbi:MAG TPA: RNA polymerase sigma factor [Sphingomicrobium sp.]|nr:RNA polymerase sigma factor [Sphingomicrobium sp.]
MTAQVAPSSRGLAELELARRCVARDPAALRELTAANNQRLFRAAWSILKDRQEAEEAVQSAYLKAIGAMGEFAGRSSLSTWLTRIVINEALGRMRAERRRRTALEAEGVAVLDQYREALMSGSEAAAPDAALARVQLRHLLERAIAGLPAVFRTVFVLREIEGLSVEEAAEALGIPPATVKTRLHRARKQLQQALAPEVRSALTGAFPFAGTDCERMTAKLLAALQIE